MADKPGGQSSSRMFWIIVLILLLVLVIGWLVSPMGKVETVQQAGEPAAQESDWAEEPTGPAVDVTLPEAPMTNAPAAPDGEPAPTAEPTG